MTGLRDRRAVARRVLAAALGMLASGCSFLSVQRARSPLEVQDPRVLDTCTTSKQAPIADTVIAAAAFVGGVVAMSVKYDADCETSTSSCGGQGYWIYGLPFYGAGALFTGSAVSGYVSTAQCRRRIVAGGRCANGDLDACQRLKPGWVPPPGWRAGPTLEPRSPPAVPAPGSPE